MRNDRLEEVKGWLGKDAKLFNYSVEGNYIRVKGKEWLNDFPRLSKVVRQYGGRYVSDGKRSHFRFPLVNEAATQRDEIIGLLRKAIKLLEGE